MAREIYISRIGALLEKEVADNQKLWLAERFGKRWSCLESFGEEQFLPPSRILILEEYGLGIFGENLEPNQKEELRLKLKKILEEKSE